MANEITRCGIGHNSSSTMPHSCQSIHQTYSASKDSTPFRTSRSPSVTSPSVRFSSGVAGVSSPPVLSRVSSTIPSTLVPGRQVPLTRLQSRTFNEIKGEYGTSEFRVKEQLQSGDRHVHPSLSASERLYSRPYVKNTAVHPVARHALHAETPVGLTVLPNFTGHLHQENQSFPKSLNTAAGPVERRLAHRLNRSSKL